MNKGINVSVVIPSYNRGAYIGAAIESVLLQDHPAVELIVVDALSTDGTIPLLKSYGDRIRWVSEKDRGHGDAVNKGWQMAGGEILAFLNADDLYVVPHAIRSAVAAFGAHPEADVVYGDTALISADEQQIYERRRPRQWDLRYAVRNCHFTIHQPAAFIRRTALERVGWLDPVLYNNDFDLWLRIGLTGTLVHIPELLAYERDCPGLSESVMMGRAKVEILKRFFSRADLPADLRAKAFRRRAYSNAWLVASRYALAARRPDLFAGYVLRAWLTDPLNTPALLARSARTVCVCMLPAWLKRFLRKLRAKGGYE